MTNFGKYAVVSSVKHVFEKEPTWFWKINPPTVKSEMEVAKLLSSETKKIGPNGTITLVPVTTLELSILELSLLFAGTNIPGCDLVEGDPLEKIQAYVGTLPRDMIIEMWETLGDACPGWGPSKKRAKAPVSETEEEAPN